MVRCSAPTGLSLLLAATTSLLSSSLRAQWQQVPALDAPPTRAGFSLTTMPNGELLLFGGDVANPAATEYAWNGIAFRPLTTPVPRRHSHAAGVDGQGRIVVFGGFGAGGTVLNDTWIFDGSTWTQSITASAPTNLVDMTMAHDPRSGGLVLVGSTFPPGLETWRFEAGNWTQLGSATLPATVATVYHDSVRAELAAMVAAGPGLQTYRLENGGWSLTTQQAIPTIFGSVVTAFDRDRGRAIGRLLGLPGATIENDGLTGRLLTGTVPPTGFTQRLAYHGARFDMTCVVSTAPLSVWRWLPDPAPVATAHGAPCSDPTFALGVAAGDVPQLGATHRLAASGANGSFATLSALGFSHTSFGALPLPIAIPLGSAGCQLRVEPSVVNVLGIGLPQTQTITVPANPVLLGASYDAQCLQLDGSGIRDASNGLEVRIGIPLPENVLLETFANDLGRDPVASGDLWTSGLVVPVAIGGDGRHGSFDATLGTSAGANVYVWNTDDTVIPASRTLTGSAAAVTDGVFAFTDFVLPAGVTVRFVGSSPARIFVRGRVDVQGTISADAADMPFTVPTTGPLAGQRLTTFDARGPLAPATSIDGQAGGLGGPGGGNGGAGGKECLTIPIVVGGVPVCDGQRGQDVKVFAGHAYAAAALGTGGAGSVLHPPSGLAGAGAPFLPGAFTFQFRDEFSPGGAGGGYSTAGTQPGLPTIPGGVAQPAVGPAPAAGALFALLPFPINPPSGYQTLDHFLVGGSGGGGGGSHSFGSLSLLTQNVFSAGHGGSGGGGAVALRAGGDVQVSGSITARGGAGVVINGDNPATSTHDVDFGVSSPGGGGSGGSVVLQSATNVLVAGTLDTNGGAGSRVDDVSVTTTAPTQIAVQAQAGAGSQGSYRLEAAGAVTFAGTGFPFYVPGVHSGPLNDQDRRTGSRSTWFVPATTELPVYLRYELLADVGGVTLLFSDDPNVSTLAANDPNGAVVVRFQGARLDASGAVVAGTQGPWRAQLAPGVDAVNGDRATAVRFDLVVDKGQGPVLVRELRIVWR